MKLLFVICTAFILLSCEEHVGFEQIKVQEKQKKCTNGYQITFRFEKKTLDDKVTEKALLKIRKDGQLHNLKLIPTRSGSGSKYKTADGKHIFWEHQDSFTYGTEDSVYCECN